MTTDLQIGKIAELANFLTTQESGMKKTFRWWKFPQAKMCRWQNSYEHTVDITWLTIIVSDHLLNFYPNLDRYTLLKGAFLHDFGEIIFDADSPGDVSFIHKENDKSHREGELKVFNKLFDSFHDHEQIKANLLPYYLLQYANESEEADRLLNTVGLKDWKDLLFKRKKFEAVVFDAIEKLGYLIFVYQEYLKDKEKSLPLFVCIARKHYTELLKYSKEIKGFSNFYSELDNKNIEIFLEKNKDIPDAFMIAEEIIREEQIAQSHIYSIE